MKNERQKKILEIIDRQPVETQEALIALLEAHGFHATQSTISRDIKQLHLIKEPWGEKAYRYAVSKKRDDFDSFARLRKIMHDCCLSCDYAQNLLIIKTLPGLGSAAGSTVDAMGHVGLLGCVSGDDTVLVILRDEESAAELCRKIHLMCK